MQALQNSSVLSQDKIILKMTTEARVVVEATKTCHIRAPSRHVLKLQKILYFVNAAKNIISVFAFYKLCYNNQFNINEYLIFFKNILVSNVVNTNDLYVLN